MALYPGWTELYGQYLNCRGDGGDTSPHRDLDVPQWRFKHRMMRGKKDLQSPVEYSTKFRGSSDSEEKTLPPSAKTFFFWCSPNFP